MENKMTDKEFDVLDELYFLTSFDDLFKSCNLNQTELKQILISLLDKGWVKCFKNKDEEVPEQEIDLENSFQQYNYLATKSGLFAHNSKS